MQIMVHTPFCLGLTAVTGERLDKFYLFSRLKHLLEYISVYEWTAGVTTAFRTRERQNLKWRHNTGKFYHSWQTVFKWMSPVEAFPVHHTVKQLTMTLMLCERTEHVWCMRLRARAITPTWHHWRQLRWIFRWMWKMYPSPSLWVH